MPYLEVKTRQGNKRMKLDGSTITVGASAGQRVAAHGRAGQSPPLRDRAVRRRLSGCVTCGSRNGTEAQQIAASPSEILYNGDVVRIGATELRFIRPRAVQRAQATDVPDFSVRRRRLATLGPHCHAGPTIDPGSQRGAVTDAKTGYERKLARDHRIGGSRRAITAKNDISPGGLPRRVTVHQARRAPRVSISGHGRRGRRERARLPAWCCWRAFRARATDIHLEPRVADAAALRLRGGRLACSLPVELELSRCIRKILNVVKVLCEIETSQNAT